MKRYLLHIVMLLAVALVFVPSCNKEEARIIPRAKLARIYAEMLVTDQWINNTPKARNIADTSLVYDPILEKYGYTPEDYQLSVMQYMNDPERFSRILRTSVQILDDELKSLRKEQARQLRRKMRLESIEIPELRIFNDPFLDSRLTDWSDSLKVEWDTVGNMYVIVRKPRTDTVYDGVRMTVPADTLVVSDSLAGADTLKHVMK